MTRISPPDFYSQDKGRLRFYPHPGQYRVLNSEARFVMALAGTQGGKTVLGPLWLLQEIQRRGPGDYMVVAPNYPLLSKKVLPEFLRLFISRLNLGEYRSSEKIFEAWDGTKVFFGYALDSTSLESATARAVWLDECGQPKFRLSSWEAIQRRLSVYEGRALMTTTPYALNWIKTEVYDRWRAGDINYQVIQFNSIQNPAFPRSEYERARATLPGWKFRMFYEAEFTRPAGMIYADFDFERQVIKPFTIPEEWPRIGGVDFGAVNFASLLAVQNPENGVIYLVDEYRAGGRTAAEHVERLRSWNAATYYGGAQSERQWRQELQAAGLPINAPLVADVEVGIDRVTALIKSGRFFVFDTLRGLLDELGGYSREVDDEGRVTDKIQDKNDYHELDALRYLAPHYMGGQAVRVQNPFYD